VRGSSAGGMGVIAIGASVTRRNLLRPSDKKEIVRGEEM